MIWPWLAMAAWFVLAVVLAPLVARRLRAMQPRPVEPAHPSNADRETPGGGGR